MDGELLSTATDAGVFSSRLSSGNLSYMNECMAVCLRCVSYWLADWLIECELAWCYRGRRRFLCLWGRRCCVVSRACVSSTSPPPPVLGFSLAVAARVVRCVWPLVRPPSPPLNVSFSLADIQFEWLAAAG